MKNHKALLFFVPFFLLTFQAQGGFVDWFYQQSDSWLLEDQIEKGIDYGSEETNNQPIAPSKEKKKQVLSTPKSKMQFEENVGQLPDEVRFQVRAPNADVRFL